ncbi:peptide ABC transporter substrate-binding protein [Brachyspira hyodysenteriae]|uniref:peptide ABC transporter substrate-binding protein n=1 Tax=Brachyspira hyodysenteriae TaxID=159 RepID=UPI00063D9E54|nr:peptide ABC transporter substrate-binding protein [Brachyspira hyodysenteriae]KLI28094.1 peptide ABC transporter substrate-binding protein [Brachyspira hyodysenteriae]TVL65513.1 peptide ABC transporter substrate-binding protein [Brachyspira hyodysenteriae]TVL74661.1 peptide ABC transporter substrate-binding protein [Brachyspira hyodysenteriae]TVL83201.1 peptide ABC transporter substrate-binding protein [Brachyspira hyodysenteriae]
MKKIITVFLMAASLFVLSCGGSGGNSNDAIVINMGAEPRTIDPSLNSLNVVSAMLYHPFESLTKIGADGKLTGGMAESWDISEDGKTYTFHLRTNALWSDGKPVTAYDFEYSWKRVVNPDVAAQYASLLEIIKNAKEINAGNMDYNELGVKAIDDHTFQVELVDPAAYFLEFMTTVSVFAPVRKDIIEQYGDDWTLSPETYICNGPYQMTERVMDEYITFEARTNYYNDETVAKKLKFISMADPNTAIAGIRGGTIHFSALEPPSSEIEKLKAENYIALKDGVGTFYLSLNITNNALKDKRVRQALSLAIDRNYLVSNVTMGGQAAAQGFVPPSMDGINGPYREEAGILIDTDNYTANVEKAKAFMAEAGYANGEGFPVLEIRVSPGLHIIVAEAIQQMWKENLNIDVTLKNDEYPLVLQYLLERNFDIGSMAWNADYRDPMTMLEIMVKGNTFNYGLYDNTAYNTLVNNARKTADPAVRMKYMMDAEKLLIDDMPFIPLYHRSYTLMVSPKLKNVVYNALGKHKFNYCYIE